MFLAARRIQSHQNNKMAPAATATATTTELISTLGPPLRKVRWAQERSLSALYLKRGKSIPRKAV